MHNQYRREFAQAPNATTCPSETGGEGRRSGARAWERDRAVTLARILPFNYLWLRPSVSSFTTHILSSFFFNHLEDKVDYNYQGNNNFINGSQVPCLDCKGYLTCQTLTQLNVIGSNMDAPSDYHTKSSKSDKKDIPDITHMWDLKNDANELIYKTETDIQK